MVKYTHLKEKANRHFSSDMQKKTAVNIPEMLVRDNFLKTKTSLDYVYFS